MSFVGMPLITWFAAAAGGALIGGLVREPLSRTFNHVFGGKADLSTDQVNARDITEAEIIREIKNIYEGKNPPRYGFLETADRLFFVRKSDESDPEILVLNLENHDSHYLQTKSKYMQIDEAFNFIKEATAPETDFYKFAQGYVPEMDKGLSQEQLSAAEAYYHEHAKMRCSKVRKTMHKPKNIRESAEATIKTLRLLASDTKDQNNSTGNTVKIRDTEHDIIYIKPFSENIRSAYEAEKGQSVYYKRFAPSDLLAMISDQRVKMRKDYIDTNPVIPTGSPGTDTMIYALG